MATPAAVLNVLVTANTKQATAGLTKVNTQLSATEARAAKTRANFAAFGKTAALYGGAIGLGALAVGAKKAFGEFREAEKVTNQTRAVLKSTGRQAKVTGKEIENLASKISLKSGIDDEAIQKGENLLLTFTKIRNETGKGNKIFSQATQVITDMSVSLDQDLKSSAIQVGKALQDPEKGITALRRVGVNFTETQADMIKGWVAHGDQLKAQRFILKELTTEFGGSAAAQADNADKLKVAWENMFESIGKVIGPTIERAMGSLATFLNQMQSGEGQGGRFAATLKEIWEAAKPVVEWFGRAAVNVGKFAAKHPDITKVATAVGLVAAAFNVFKIGTAIKAVAAFTKAAVATPGKVREALSGVKAIFTRVFGSAGTAGGTTAAERAASGVMGSFPTKEGRMKTTTKKVMTNVGKAGGVAMAAGVIAGLAGLSAAIGNVLHKAKTDIIDPWVRRHFGKAGSIYTDIRDFIGSNLPDSVPGAPLLKQIFGKGIGDGMGHALEGFALGGAGGGGLMGANQNLAPFAALGRLYGLSVTSGLRPGSITSSGNLSLHATGNAIDVNAGSPFQMMAYAQAMKRMYGSKLKELIYTPMGVGIKNGRPVNIQSFYGSTVAADHYDHVHVALQKGGVAVPGHGSGDKVPVQALVEPGERMFVLNRNAVPAFDALNGAFPRFQSGGMVRAAKAGRAAGFKGRALQYLLAIGGAESGNYTDLIGDGGQSFSPWQIYHPAHPQYDTHRLLSDWTYAARAAYEISGGGRNWSPWTMFNNGGYRRYMARAAQAIRSIVKKAPTKKGGNKTKKRPQKGGAGVSPSPVERLSGIDIRDAFMQAFANQLNYRWAFAQLSDATDTDGNLTPAAKLDDIAVATDAVRGWQAWLDLAVKKKDQSGATTAATSLKQWRDTLTDLTAVAAIPPRDDSERVALLQHLLSEANLRTAVSQTQYGALRFGGRFAEGGTVPGPIGAPRVIVAHGGETVTPAGAGGVEVHIHGDIVNTPRGKKPVEIRDIRARSRPLPGRGGG